MRRRLLFYGLVSLEVTVILGIVLTVGPAWGYAYVVTHIGCQGDRAGLDTAGFPAEPVSFSSRDRLTLRGWLTQGSEHPEIVIIVLPGHGGNTGMAVPDAAIYAHAGYSVLIYEHRICSDSNLPSTLGYREANDLLGAVDYLRSRGDITHIGVHGYSEGGTAALLAAAQEPAIEAVVAMGALDNLETDILDAGSDHNGYERLVRHMILWFVERQIGAPPRNVSPVGEIGLISPQSVFLIYGEGEAGVGQRLYEAAGEPRMLWIVPGCNHGGYWDVAPEEYRLRITGFFADVFGVGLEDEPTTF